MRDDGIYETITVMEIKSRQVVAGKRVFDGRQRGCLVIVGSSKVELRSNVAPICFRKVLATGKAEIQPQG
jgi:hypothetical protein